MLSTWVSSDSLFVSCVQSLSQLSAKWLSSIEHNLSYRFVQVARTYIICTLSLGSSCFVLFWQYIFFAVPQDTNEMTFLPILLGYIRWSMPNFKRLPGQTSPESNVHVRRSAYHPSTSTGVLFFNWCLVLLELSQNNSDVFFIQADSARFSVCAYFRWSHASCCQSFDSGYLAIKFEQKTAVCKLNECFIWPDLLWYRCFPFEHPALRHRSGLGTRRCSQRAKVKVGKILTTGTRRTYTHTRTRTKTDKQRKWAAVKFQMGFYWRKLQNETSAIPSATFSVAVLLAWSWQSQPETRKAYFVARLMALCEVCASQVCLSPEFLYSRSRNLELSNCTRWRLQCRRKSSTVGSKKKKKNEKETSFFFFSDCSLQSRFVTGEELFAKYSLIFWDGRTGWKQSRAVGGPASETRKQCAKFCLPKNETKMCTWKSSNHFSPDIPCQNWVCTTPGLICCNWFPKRKLGKTGQKTLVCSWTEWFQGMFIEISFRDFILLDSTDRDPKLFLEGVQLIPESFREDCGGVLGSAVEMHVGVVVHSVPCQTKKWILSMWERDLGICHFFNFETLDTMTKFGTCWEWRRARRLFPWRASIWRLPSEPERRRSRSPAWWKIFVIPKRATKWRHKSHCDE